MAQAVKRLWPEVKLAIGPSIDEGWYYDMDAPFAFTPEHLEQIEAEMRKICKEKLKLERFELPREEALKFMEEKAEPYKVELINDLPADAHISFYKQGEFTDLCAGPHLDSTGRIKGNALKLTACNAAYWRGDSNRETLQRIYGIAFPKKDELDAYLQRIEEAKKRDHGSWAGSWACSCWDEGPGPPSAARGHDSRKTPCWITGARSTRSTAMWRSPPPSSSTVSCGSVPATGTTISRTCTPLLSTKRITPSSP